MKKLNELRQKMFNMNREILVMREEKKQLEREENEEFYQRGMQAYSDQENFGFRNNLRLIGRNFWTRNDNDRTTASDSRKDYYTKCKAFDIAMQNLKEFYLHNDHLSIMDDLIVKAENGEHNAKRDLTAIFKMNGKKKNRNNY